jgi:choice-of-anchor C domain-containing protein
LVAPGTALAQTNLVRNGDFEMPEVGTNYVRYASGATFGFWSVGVGNVDQIGTTWEAADGNQSVELFGNQAGSIYQDLATVPGASYRLRFAMSANSLDQTTAFLARMSVRWGGSRVAERSFSTAGRTPRSMGWSYRTYTVRATARRTRLELAGLQSQGPADERGAAVDDVTVTGASGEPPPPVAGRSVVAQVTQGTVFIRLPRGKSIRRGRGSAVTSQSRRFRRYRGKANIPVGSTVDTRRGRLKVTSASDLRGATQDGTFYDGIFQIKQQRSARPVTEAALVTSRRACASTSGRASQRRKRLGRLWVNAKGRFRTKGRYSSATVRGTTWLTEDRCDGTLTTVRRGTVAVRDRVRNRTVVLTAGQSYLARAQRASGRGG